GVRPRVEVALAAMGRCGDRVDVVQLLEAPDERFAHGERGEPLAGEAVLRGHPALDLVRRGVLEPAIGIGYRGAEQRLLGVGGPRRRVDCLRGARSASLRAHFGTAKFTAPGHAEWAEADADAKEREGKRFSSHEPSSVTKGMRAIATLVAPGA